MKYAVQVDITTRRTLKVHARDEETAKERAVEIVLKWQDVTDAEAVEVKEARGQ